MNAIESANRLFAAAFSVVISAALFAYAIVPASPSLMA
ncbi:MAG: enoyl-CoA hydratase [Erythrobacter sp.]|nr:enoyl-CoA hydratase [Erythrobacter sp.]